MDRDPRVLANAVEALWAIPGDEARPLLAAAAKVQNNRVQANALIGLYRAGDLGVISNLLKMAEHPDPVFRLSAFWAIGETGDPRFIPFLNQQFKISEGKLRLAVTRALAQIRRRERSAAQTGLLQLLPTGISSLQDGRRRVRFTAKTEPARDLGPITAADIAVFENGCLIEKYDFHAASKPAMLVAGFILPRGLESGAEYIRSLEVCLPHKRPGDLWRMDQYSLEQTSAAPARPGEEANLPYDDALISTDLKMHFGFFSDPDLIRQSLAGTVPRDRMSPHAQHALARQCEAIARLSGKKRIILLLNQGSLAEIREQIQSGALKAQLQAASATLHCVAIGEHESWKELRNFCESSSAHTFTDTIPSELPNALERLYLGLLNQFEICYESKAQSGAGVLKVTSSQGAGNMEFPLTLDRPVQDLAPQQQPAEQSPVPECPAPA